MSLRKHFTIMVVPDAQALLRRFHIRWGQIAGGIVGLIVLIVIAASSPLLLAWGIQQSREVSRLRGEKEQIFARAQEVEANIAELRQKLALQEKRAEALAYATGLSSRPTRPAEGSIVDAGAGIVGPYDRMKTETENLADRASLLDRRIATVEQAVPRQASQAARRPAAWPVKGLVGAGYGWRRDPFTGLNQFHRGLDILAPTGTPVRSPADGIVLKAGRDGGYGNVLMISHSEGVITRYGHLSAFKVKAGDKVRRGDLIALVGNTGRSTGSHLHYEILERGQNVDPMTYLPDEELF